MKKIIFYLQHASGLWSVPLGIAAFWFIGVFMQSIFGYGTGSYDPAFLQPFFLACTIVIGASNFAIMGLYFTFRTLYKYLYGKENEDGRIINHSKIDWRNLKLWQRYLVAFGAFFYYVSAILLVYLKLV